MSESSSITREGDWAYEVAKDIRLKWMQTEFMRGNDIALPAGHLSDIAEALRQSDAIGYMRGHEAGEKAARAALAQRDSLRIRLQEAERALKPFAEICDAEHMRFVGDEQVLELSTRAEVPVSEKLRGRDFRFAKAALLTQEESRSTPLPDTHPQTAGGKGESA